MKTSNLATASRTWYSRSHAAVVSTGADGEVQYQPEALSATSLLVPWPAAAQYAVTSSGPRYRLTRQHCQPAGSEKSVVTATTWLVLRW